MRTAYGAGLLVGWGETGRRPQFALVTAVGKSALIAPFAFIGAEGDQKIADIFTCAAGRDWTLLARQTALLIDSPTVQAIARRHEAGARLLVALPASAARRETIWDLGAIAASGHPKAAEYIGNVLSAAVDLVSIIDPNDLPVGAGSFATRNPNLRKPGAGEAFLWPRSSKIAPTSHYLIHNGVFFGDESDDYVTDRQLRGDQATTPEVWLIPAFDFRMQAVAKAAHFQFASLKPMLNLVAQSSFDPAYLRDLFLHAYRQGRMGKEWRSALPTAAQ